MRGLKQLVFSLLGLFWLLSLSSCGLERIVYLEKPEPVTFSEADATFTFRKILENDEYEFRGFELFYKLQTVDETTEGDIQDFNTLASKGFFRVSSDRDRSTNIDKPLIEVPFKDGTEFDIVVDFSPIPNPVVSTPDETTVPDVNMRRGVAYTSGPDIYSFEHFYYSLLLSDAIGGNDADISSAVWVDIEAGNPVLLVLYVLSYGKKDLVVDVYSEPLYLGNIGIIF